jgi:hypothetical protein
MYLDNNWRSKMKLRKTSEVFRVAKTYLNRGDQDKTDYICVAIGHAQWDKLVTNKAADRARQVIGSRLQDNVSVTEWLKDRGYVPRTQSPYNNKQVQRYRHRWLNALIKEFEAKGD